MFRITATADHLPAFNLEHALEVCAWTDVLHITVDGVEVYRDVAGLGSDLVPAFDVVREQLLERFTPFVVALGRREGDFEVVTTLSSSRWQVEWVESVRDLGLDQGAGERPEEHLQRLKGLLRTGYLAQVQRVLSRGFQDHLACARGAGLEVRPGTVRGPWLHLRGEEADRAVAELHGRFGGKEAPLATDRALLKLVLDDPGAPDIDVRVDHYGEVLSLSDFRDVLAALATPPPGLAYPS